MAAEISQLSSASNITWSNGTLFNGFVVLTMVLPGNRTTVALKDSRPILTVPQNVRISIREGVYETDTKIWRTNSLVPPGVQYSAAFYDSNGVFIASSATPFSVTTDPYVLAPPSLATPAATYSKGADMAPHNMTANDAPAPYVASASSYLTNPDQFRAFTVFDGSFNYYWIGVNKGSEWLQIDLGATPASSLYSYALMVTFGNAARTPKSWTLMGSQNGTAWDVLDYRDSQTWSAGETREFVLASVPAIHYRYFRLGITANNGDPDYTELVEMYLYAAVQV